MINSYSTFRWNPLFKLFCFFHIDFTMFISFALIIASHSLVQTWFLLNGACCFPVGNWLFLFSMWRSAFSFCVIHSLLQVCFQEPELYLITWSHRASSLDMAPLTNRKLRLLSQAVRTCTILESTEWNQWKQRCITCWYAKHADGLSTQVTIQCRELYRNVFRATRSQSDREFRFVFDRARPRNDQNL
jgi:hypothetical protein